MQVWPGHKVSIIFVLHFICLMAMFKANFNVILAAFKSLCWHKFLAVSDLIPS